MEVRVSDPRVVREGSLKSSTHYTVTSSGGTLGSDYNSVERRFSDFSWLHDTLGSSSDLKGYFIPPMAPKTKTSANYMEKRMNELELFLTRCVSGQLAQAPELIAFLKEADLNAYKARRVKLKELKHTQSSTGTSWFGLAKTKMSENGHIKAVAASVGKDLTVVKSADDIDADNMMSHLNELVTPIKALQQRCAAALAGYQGVGVMMAGIAQGFGSLGQLELGQGDATGSSRVQLASVVETVAAQDDVRMDRISDRLLDMCAMITAAKAMLKTRETKRVENVTEQNRLDWLRQSTSVRYEEETKNQVSKCALMEEELQEVHKRMMEEMRWFKRWKTQQMGAITKEWLQLQIDQSSRLHGSLLSVRDNLEEVMTNAEAQEQMRVQNESMRLAEEARIEISRQFGKPLGLLEMEAAPGYSSRVPSVLMKLQRSLEQHGARGVLGVFRLAPDAEDCKRVKAELNAGTYLDCDDVNIVATLIKLFFRELPQRLFDGIPELEMKRTLEMTNEEVSTFLEATMVDPELTLTYWLLDLMAGIVTNQEVNKMGVKNMAIVMSPNLLLIHSQNPTAALCLSQLVTDFTAKLLESRLMTHFYDCYAEDVSAGESVASVASVGAVWVDVEEQVV